MGEDTKIAWTDHTFNPWWGCQRVSPGCEHCYAEGFAKRVGYSGKRPDQGPPRATLPLLWGPGSAHRFFGEKHWKAPLEWAKKATAEGRIARVFCASMADVFEDRRDLDEWRTRLWFLIEDTAHALNWQLLTKRPENMERLAPVRWADEWPDNVWAGCTAEDQMYYERRWPTLARVPAAVRFISHEPALGPLRVTEALDHHDNPCFPDWVITGGESGPRARPYDVDWAHALIHETPVDTAVFVKQLGASPQANGAPMTHPLQRLDPAWTVPSHWPASLQVQQFPDER